ISTVARSGFRSPSKSAIAKFELNPAEETGDGFVEVLAAFTQPAAPRTKQRTRTARRGPFVTSKLSWIRESMNSSLKRSFLERTAQSSPARIPFPVGNLSGFASESLRGTNACPADQLWKRRQVASEPTAVSRNAHHRFVGQVRSYPP